MSPTIFREGAFRFYFFSREETRMHGQVQASSGEAKFWLEPSIGLATNHELNALQVADAQNSSRSTSMKFVSHGIPTSVVEVTNISPHGFWLLLDESEKFVAFDLFPWFRDATVAQIVKLERPSQHQLYWPELDIDLSVDSLDHPERFPLISKMPTAELQPNLEVQLGP
jgi:hypothetical protein